MTLSIRFHYESSCAYWLRPRRDHIVGRGVADSTQQSLPVCDYAAFVECRRVAHYKFAFMLQFHMSHHLK